MNYSPEIVIMLAADDLVPFGTRPSATNMMTIIDNDAHHTI